MSDSTPRWIFDDGGRLAAGIKGKGSDCGPRALAIAAQLPYREAVTLLSNRQAAWAQSSRSLQAKITRAKGASARTGVWPDVMRLVMAELGWNWTPAMLIGSGARVHLLASELPSGRIICSCSRHFTAVVDGVIRDTHDPSRGGKRTVYGYWTQP